MAAVGKKYTNILWDSNGMKEIKLEVKAGITIYASTGMSGRNQPDRMSSMQFYLADKSSRLQLLDKQYYFNVATYALEFDQKYLHSYAYAPEQGWVTYTEDLRGDSYQQEEYVFGDNCYFRVCLKRADGADFCRQEEERIDKILKFISTARENNEINAVFLPEVKRTAEKIRDLKTEGSLVLAVITDTHYTVNGTWRDTAKNMHAVHREANFDSIVHLGDLTDGMVPRELTVEYVERMLSDLKQLHIPVHIVLGNHDANYFAGNPDVFSLEEQVELYQKHSQSYKSDPSLPYYYTDYKEQGIRCIFLNAYDNNEKVRYGFDWQQVKWLEDVLRKSSENYGILIFSHDAPLAKLDYWSDEIRNGEALMDVLERHQRKQNTILAYIHGHAHADYVYTERLFPIISIGCAKCEDMQEKKAEGFVTEKRELGMITQELWDILIVKPNKRQIEFVRFGAGKDKTISTEGK